MAWLRSNDQYDVLADFNPVTGEYKLLSRQKVGAAAGTRCDGVFAILSGTFAALYRFGDQLFFRIGDATYPLTDDAAVAVTGPACRRVLVVEVGGREIARHAYGISDEHQFADDPTPFIAAEDFDFGLLASNISRDKSRKQVMLGGK